jgi:superfamily II DNA/RNA helicase
MNILKRNGFNVSIIFGDMTGSERDEYIERFRSREINIVITTNILARGLDVPEV